MTPYVSTGISVFEYDPLRYGISEVGRHPYDLFRKLLFEFSRGVLALTYGAVAVEYLVFVGTAGNVRLLSLAELVF